MKQAKKNWRPSTNKAGAFVYRLLWDEKQANLLNAAGALNESDLELLIDPTMHELQQKETLIHETLHAIWKQCQLRVDIPDSDSNSPGEMAIQNLSPRILEWMRDNKETVEWILKD